LCGKLFSFSPGVEERRFSHSPANPEKSGQDFTISTNKQTPTNFEQFHTLCWMLYCRIKQICQKYFKMETSNPVSAVSDGPQKNPV